jgi:hypothetical protein
MLKYKFKGGEDDDLRKRVDFKNYTASRSPLEIGRYAMASHTSHSLNKINPQRFKLLESSELRIDFDGLNSLKYELVKSEELPLFTRVKVKYDQDIIMLSAPVN